MIDLLFNPIYSSCFIISSSENHPASCQLSNRNCSPTPPSSPPLFYLHIASRILKTNRQEIIDDQSDRDLDDDLTFFSSENIWIIRSVCRQCSNRDIEFFFDNPNSQHRIPSILNFHRIGQSHICHKCFTFPEKWRARMESRSDSIWLFRQLSF